MINRAVPSQHNMAHWANDWRSDSRQRQGRQRHRIGEFPFWNDKIPCTEQAASR